MQVELDKLHKTMQEWANIPLASDCTEEELPILDIRMNEWYERLEKAFEAVEKAMPTE